MLSRIILKVSLLIVAFMFVLVSIGFFIGSLYLYLEVHFDDSALAAFFCGLAVLLIAILLLLITLLCKNRKKKIKFESSLEDLSDSSFDVLGLIAKYPWQSSLVGVATGLLLGFVPGIRNSLIDAAATYLNGGSLGDCLRKFRSRGSDDDE